MLRRLLPAVTVGAAIGLLPVPARAMTVTFVPAPDFGACVTITFTQPTTAVGELSAIGILNGPGTITVPVVSARIVDVVDGTSWSGCVSGGYSFATYGAVVVSFAVTTPSVTYADARVCTAVSGAVRCS